MLPRAMGPPLWHPILRGGDNSVNSGESSRRQLGTRGEGQPLHVHIGTRRLRRAAFVPPE